MDDPGSIWPWIVEFVLLEPIDSEWADNVIAVIPPSRLSDSLLEPRIKKALHLRSLAYDLHHRSFTFRTLQTLELIEEIDRPTEITQSMCRVYWAVAAECTARSDQGDGDGAADKDDLEGLLDRLWKARIENLKGEKAATELLSPSISRWRTCLVRMMPDPEALNQLLRQTTKDKAVELLGVYLKETTRQMGPSFLALQCEKASKAEVDRLGTSTDAGAGALGADAGNSGGLISPEMAAPASNIETDHNPVEACTGVRPSATALEKEGQGKENETGMPKEAHHGDKDAHGTKSQSRSMKETMNSNTHKGKRILPLMSWNPTAQTHQWGEDSDLTTPEEGPSERRWRNLKKSVRRVPRKWSAEEENTLREAVKRFGKGRWKLILDIYQATFEGRTEVDLKDKWRNMTAR